MALSKFGTLGFVFKYTKRRIWLFILGMIMLIVLTFLNEYSKGDHKHL